jgi:hypothetical protein
VLISGVTATSWGRFRRPIAIAIAGALLGLLGLLASSGRGLAAGEKSPGVKSPNAPVEQAERRSTASPLFGFMDDPNQHLFAIDAAVDIGANIGRVTIPWYFTGWSQLDKVYDAFYTNGIRPMFTLAVTPPPGPIPLPPGPIPPIINIPIPAPQPENLPPAPDVPDAVNFKPAEFAEQAAYMVQRYPWAKIQLLNEPNLPQFRSFTVDQTVETVVTAARAIHAIAPQAKVIGPAASPDQGRGFAYTRAVYSRLPPDLDYVEAGVNIYPGPGRRRAFKQIKKSWRTARASGRKVWVTEITPGIYSPRRRRCNQIKEAFAYLKARGAKGILFFRLREPQVLQNVQGRLWVVNLDGTHTDLYRCLKKAAKRLRRPGQPGRPRLRMNVVGIEWVHRGGGLEVRIRITARPDYGSLGSGPSAPVAGARVSIGGKETRTNKLGLARIEVSIGNLNRLRIRARRQGYASDSDTIAIARLRSSGPGK